MRVRQMIGAFLVAATASCSLGGPEDAGSINVFVAVEPATIQSGESMSIYVTARNVGLEALTLTGPSDCLLLVEILDTDGHQVWNSTGSCTGGTVTETLAPGAEKLQTFVWNGTNNAGAPLTPSFYLVRAIARLSAGAYIGQTISVAIG